MLEHLDQDLYIAARPLRFLGVETGARMTLVRLSGGDLFAHSPIPLTPALRAAVDELGPVKAVIAPSLFHHLSVDEWLRAYPEAAGFACPGLDAKRSDIAWRGVLGDDPEPEWAGDLEQVFFAARTMENEVVFFHPPTRSLICCDAIFNLRTHPSRFTRLVARALGNDAPGATWLERLMIRDRAGAREQLDRMLAWRPERIILSHGALVESGGSEVLRRAYAWI